MALVEKLDSRIDAAPLDPTNGRWGAKDLLHIWQIDGVLQDVEDCPLDYPVGKRSDDYGPLAYFTYAFGRCCTIRLFKGVALPQPILNTTKVTWKVLGKIPSSLFGRCRLRCFGVTTDRVPSANKDTR